MKVTLASGSKTYYLFSLLSAARETTTIGGMFRKSLLQHRALLLGPWVTHRALEVLLREKSVNSEGEQYTHGPHVALGGHARVWCHAQLVVSG